MRSRILWFWYGVLIQGAIACVCSSGASANVYASESLTALSTKAHVELSEIADPIQQTSDQTLVQAPPTPVAPAPNQIQPDPNSDRFPQPAPAPSPLPSETQTPAVPATPEPSPSPAPASGSIQVNKIQVTGSTVFTPEQFTPIISPLEGRTVSLEQLREAADKITQLYLERGYITSRAILAEGAIANGVVPISVIEGSLESIEIQGTQRLNPDYVRQRVRLGAGVPLSTGNLEDRLRLLRAEPLFENIEASLRPGTEVGKSILVVRVTEAKPFQGNVSLDNYSPPVVGGERAGLNLIYRNLTGRGDEISGSYYRTLTGGANIFDLSYRLPLNPMNGTLELRYSPSSNSVTQPPFDVLDIGGDSQLYEISYRQPLTRSPREEFALSLGFAYQNGVTFIGNTPTPFTIGAEPNGATRTSTIKFGQDYIIRDVGGAWALRSLFSLGTGLFGTTINAEPVPDSRFFSWLGQVQRVQVLNNDNTLIVQGNIQLTPNALFPAQQFVIGGGTSVRGYRQNVRAGDNGIRFSVEDRITLQRNASAAPTFILAPFVDLGLVWNRADNPNTIPNQQRFLAGAGVGLLWQPLSRLNLRLDYGVPLVNLTDRGNNIQDDGLYFSVNYRF